MLMAGFMGRDGCEATLSMLRESAFPPWLKPAFIHLAYAGVETPASVESRNEMWDSGIVGWPFIQARTRTSALQSAGRPALRFCSVESPIAEPTFMSAGDPLGHGYSLRIEFLRGL